MSGGIVNPNWKTEGGYEGEAVIVTFISRNWPAENTPATIAQISGGDRVLVEFENGTRAWVHKKYMHKRLSRDDEHE